MKKECLLAGVVAVVGTVLMVCSRQNDKTRVETEGNSEPPLSDGQQDQKLAQPSTAVERSVDEATDDTPAGKRFRSSPNQTSVNKMVIAFGAFFVGVAGSLAGAGYMNILGEMFDGTPVGTAIGTVVLVTAILALLYIGNDMTATGEIRHFIRNMIVYVVSTIVCVIIVGNVVAYAYRGSKDGMNTDDNREKQYDEWHLVMTSPARINIVVDNEYGMKADTVEHRGDSIVIVMRNNSPSSPH